MNKMMARFVSLTSMRVLLGLLVVLGVLGGQADRGTLAFFTTTAASTANTFESGSIELDLTDANGGAETLQDAVTASITANVATNTWRPGQVVTQPITVTNSGTLSLTYGIAYTAADTGTTPDGASATPTQFLTLAIKKGGTAGQCTTGLFGGAPWSSTLVAATALSTSGATLLTDTSQTLAASAADVLCFQVAFTNGSSGVENAAMGGTSTIAFNFSGRQLP